MDGKFFPYGAGEKCMENVVRRMKQKMLLDGYRCVRVENIKINLKKRTFNILICSHPFQPRFQWVCFRHVNEVSVCIECGQFLDNRASLCDSVTLYRRMRKTSLVSWLVAIGYITE